MILLRNPTPERMLLQELKCVPGVNVPSDKFAKQRAFPLLQIRSPLHIFQPTDWQTLAALDLLSPALEEGEASQNDNLGDSADDHSRNRLVSEGHAPASTAPGRNGIRKK